MNCRRCKTPMSLLSAELEGRAGDTEVKVTGFPYYRCSRCGAHAYVNPDFNQYLIESAMKATPVASKGGLGRRPRCTKCGSNLGETAPTPELIQTSLEVPGYHLGMEVRAPGFACPSCGTHQLQGGAAQVSSNWADAMIAAFKPLEPINFWKVS